MVEVYRGHFDSYRRQRCRKKNCETAIIEINQARGHRLTEDDAVEIRRVSAKTLVGSYTKNIRPHFIELRAASVI